MLSLGIHQNLCITWYPPKSLYHLVSTETVVSLGVHWSRCCWLTVILRLLWWLAMSTTMMLTVTDCEWWWLRYWLCLRLAMMTGCLWLWWWQTISTTEFDGDWLGYSPTMIVSMSTTDWLWWRLTMFISDYNGDWRTTITTDASLVPTADDWLLWLTDGLL